MKKIIAALENKGLFRLAKDLSDIEAKKPWGTLPKGWTKDSLKKFAQHLSQKGSKGFVTKCIKKLKGTGITNPGAFCSSLKDKYVGKKTWRGKGK